LTGSPGNLGSIGLEGVGGWSNFSRGRCDGEPGSPSGVSTGLGELVKVNRRVRSDCRTFPLESSFTLCAVLALNHIRNGIHSSVGARHEINAEAGPLASGVQVPGDGAFASLFETLARTGGGGDDACSTSTSDEEQR